MSQPHKPFSPCWPDNSEAQTCFIWANTHPDKALLVEEAVKSWGMSHSRLTPTFKNARPLVWALDCEDTSQIYWRQLHPWQEWQGVRGQARELTLNSGAAFLCQWRLLRLTKQRAVFDGVNLGTKTTVFLFSLFYKNTPTHQVTGKKLPVVMNSHLYAISWNILLNGSCL